MRPEPLWRWSTVLHRRGLTPLAKLLKLVNYVVFGAVLPYEVRLGRGVNLWHRGLGVVIHPNTEIGDDVGLGHMVTISGLDGASPTRIGDGVRIGSHAVLLPARGQGIIIGDGARIGAASVVTRDVEAGSTVAGNPARPTRPSPQ